MATPKLRIVIPGGSGHIGTSLARHFHTQGHSVTVFSRTLRPMPWHVVAWDISKPGPWIDDLEGSDVCINLTGKSVNCRYTAANKKEIYDSRIQPTLKLQ